MSTKSVQSSIIPAVETMEGAGVTVHRTIGSPALRNYDPFLLLDHLSSGNPQDYIAGFPPHPHRGFVTFTYIIDGDMEHKDSLGNTGRLGPGGAQWMKAASGVVHSEMPSQENGLLRGFQLWINLPAAHKMDAPAYQEYKSEAFPVVETREGSVKVLAGRYGDVVAPVVDEITQVSYLDVQVNPGKRFSHTLSSGNNSFLYLFEGSGQLDGQEIPLHALAIPGQCYVEYLAGSQGARFLLVSGKPIGEPVVQYGPFVMNTREEIEQAIHDYQTNSFVRERAWTNRKQKTEG